MSVVTIGLDLAKSVFQVHGVDAAGQTVLRRRLGRTDLLPFFAKQPSCLLGWRRVRARTIGRESWAGSDTRFGSFRRNT
jgi:hypothetical protein